MRGDLTCLAFLFLTLQANAQAGGIDISFNTADLGFGYGDGAFGLVRSTTLQSDGKIIIGGAFTSYNGTGQNCIARLNADGSLDDSFDTGTATNNVVYATVLQADGRTIIAGAFSSYNGTARSRIARLNTDGSLDASFDPGVGPNNAVLCTAIQNDGKFFIGGNFTAINGTARNRLARLNMDGSLDTSFDPGTGAGNSVLATAIQADGKVIIGGNFTSINGTTCGRIARLNSDGSLDASFNTGQGATNSVTSITLQADGRIIIGGSFTNYNGTGRNNLVRLNADGSVDTSFDTGTTTYFDVRTALVRADGKIIIGGNFSLTRLNADGSLDASFSTGTAQSTFVWSIAEQNDGRIIIGGNFANAGDLGRNRVARLHADGELDVSFNPGTGSNWYVLASAVQADGKILAGGMFTSFNGTGRNFLARLNADGTLDPTFDIGSGASWAVLSFALQADSKIIVGGAFSGYNGTAHSRIVRLNPDGSLDASFNPAFEASSSVKCITLQSDGKIIIGGLFTYSSGPEWSNIARLNMDGSVDATFDPGTGANNDVEATALQADGKIIVGGDFTSINGTACGHVARLNADGSLDASFNPGAGADGYVKAIALQADGKIIIGGDFNNYDGMGHNRIVRLNADGSVDASFLSGAGVDGYVRAIALRADGKIIVGGEFTSYDGAGRNNLARLNADGSLDTSFDPGSGANDVVFTTALQTDGGIIIGGGFTSYDGTGRNRMARVFGSASTSIEAPNEEMDIVLWPNPANELINIRTSDNKWRTTRIMNALGQQVFHSSRTDVLPLHGFAAGIYSLQTLDAEGRVLEQVRLVKH
ncbi:MAG: hypothetical protein IPL64_00780 [Flavobacteriales bacterium]|nr:hypothetical protein [Flavobacteriales bacterium]MBK8707614.1 hypothetical protein [Flavobacteriales bacterium]HQW07143.1 hypothetical protein [Flavobacteriales bacterium]